MPVTVEPLQVGLAGCPPAAALPLATSVNQWLNGPAAACVSAVGIEAEKQLGSPTRDGLYMTRIGPEPTRLTSSPMVKSGGSLALFAKNSSDVPMMSPVASETPLPDCPPGVLESSACPNSCPTTSKEPIQAPAVLWPTATRLPSQNAFSSLRPMSIGKPRPVPVIPLRPNQAPNMSHSRCTVNSASTQPVSRLVPTPLPHTLSVPVSTAPVLMLRQEMPVRVGSVIENDVPAPLVAMFTVP